MPLDWSQQYYRRTKNSMNIQSKHSPYQDDETLLADVLRELRRTFLEVAPFILIKAHRIEPEVEDKALQWIIRTLRPSAMESHILLSRLDKHLRGRQRSVKR